MVVVRSGSPTLIPDLKKVRHHYLHAFASHLHVSQVAAASAKSIVVLADHGIDPDDRFVILLC